MRILINHEGKNNAEVLGANSLICKVNTERILDQVRSGKIKTVPEIYAAILGPDANINDAEKLCIFYMVNRALEAEMCILIIPKM